MKQASPTGPRYKPPLPAIRVGSSDRTDLDLRFAGLLVWYMRVLALLWMVQGVLHWSSVMTSQAGGQDLFEGSSTIAAAAIVFFCVLDLIAAVGLWLISTWGGVVWLVAVAAQWLTTAALPHQFPYDPAVAACDVLLVAGYFYLTYRAAQESEIAR